MLFPMSIVSSLHRRREWGKKSSLWGELGHSLHTTLAAKIGLKKQGSQPRPVVEFATQSRASPWENDDCWKARKALGHSGEKEASGIVKSENLFMLEQTRMPSQPQTRLRGCRALTAPRRAAAHGAGGAEPREGSVHAGTDSRGMKTLVMTTVPWLRFSTINQNQQTHARSYCRHRWWAIQRDPVADRSSTPMGLALFSPWSRDSSNYYRHYLDKQILWLWTRQYPSFFKSTTTIVFFSCLFNPHNWKVVGAISGRLFCSSISHE